MLPLFIIVLPLLGRMGLRADMSMERPGYVPMGGGVLHLMVQPNPNGLHPVSLSRNGGVARVWGIALASHLDERRVADRMAASAQVTLEEAGYQPDLHVIRDGTAAQPGGVLALFADLDGGGRLGSDRAGARGRTSESIGADAAHGLVRELKSGAAVDAWTADQVLPFAALADGESQFQIAHPTDHVQANAWLADMFLGTKVTVAPSMLAVSGLGKGSPSRNEEMPAIAQPT